MVYKVIIACYPSVSVPLLSPDNSTMFEINIHKLWIMILPGMINLPFVLFCNTKSMCMNLRVLAIHVDTHEKKRNAYDSNLALYMHAESVTSVKSS